MIILSQQEAETIYSFLCDLRAEGDMMRNEKLPGTISWLRVRIDNSSPPAAGSFLPATNNSGA